MKTIDLEAHFVTEEYIAYLRSRKTFPKLETVEGEKQQKFDRVWYEPNLCQSRTVATSHQLLDLGDGRLSEMDAAGIDMQVISLTEPGCDLFDISEAIPIARKANDDLSQVIKKHPDRFIGLATLALQDPSEAADELERAVNELGLRGAKMNSNTGGEYLDDQKYWTVFERAEKLGVPIYLHPMVPSVSMRRPYVSYGWALAGASLGFGAETALHAMRLICSGLFDKYPKLKIILGHLGEALPFWLHRIDSGWLRPLSPGELGPKCKKRPSEYLKTNFIVTTSGMFFEPAFLCVYMALGADNISFAVDYPYADNRSAVQFIRAVPICEDDKQKICHLNAEKLFRA